MNSNIKSSYNFESVKIKSEKNESCFDDIGEKETAVSSCREIRIKTEGATPLGETNKEAEYSESVRITSEKDESCFDISEKETPVSSCPEIRIKIEGATPLGEINKEVEHSNFSIKGLHEKCKAHDAIEIGEPSWSSENFKVEHVEGGSCSVASETDYSKTITKNEQDTSCTSLMVVEEDVNHSNQKEKQNTSPSCSEIETEKQNATSTDGSEKEVSQYDFTLKNLPKEYKQAYYAYINEVKAVADIPIVKSVSNSFIENFKYFNTRYYEDKYCVNFNVSTDIGYCDTLIRIHTNKLLLVALASGNDIIRNNRDLLYINFCINNSDRSNIQLKGKKKRGSKAVEPQTILCQVKFKNDSRVYNIRAGVYGRIIEINEHIKMNPNLIRTDPKGLGFIAVLTPRGNPQEYEDSINKLGLLSEEEYFKYILERPVRPSSS